MHQSASESIIHFIDCLREVYPILVSGMFVFRKCCQSLPYFCALDGLFGSFNLFCISLCIVLFELLQVLDTHLHKFLTTAMTLDIGSKEHNYYNHKGYTYYNYNLLKMIIGFQLHILFCLFLIIVEGVGLGDSFVVGDKV